MAEELQIQGTDERGKVRHPLGILGLMLITLGIYFFYWWFQVNKEMAAIGRARNTNECGDSPSTSLLAMFPGLFIIVPPYVSFYKGSKRVNAAARHTGAQEGLEPGLMLLLYILIGPVAIYLLQSTLNKALQAQAGGAAQIQPGAAQPAPGPPPQPSPQQQPPPAPERPEAPPPGGAAS
jgi:Domain of unknown function (DUF4234)